jgi:predicted Ser/Thr protein kinase
VGSRRVADAADLEKRETRSRDGRGDHDTSPGTASKEGGGAGEPVLASDTRKNRVLLYEDRVVKVFKSYRSSRKHARQEIAALERLAGMRGVPVVLALGADGMSLTMSRVPGKPLTECTSVSESTFVSLRGLIEEMLGRGVARHSLPPRDVIVASDGSAGLVDFERSTQRRFPGDPFWLVAKEVTRFHLRRLLSERAPQLLTPEEQRRHRRHDRIRTWLQHPAGWKRRVLRALRRR